MAECDGKYNKFGIGIIVNRDYFNADILASYYIVGFGIGADVSGHRVRANDTISGSCVVRAIAAPW